MHTHVCVHFDSPSHIYLTIIIEKRIKFFFSRHYASRNQTSVIEINNLISKN